MGVGSWELGVGSQGLGVESQELRVGSWESLVIALAIGVRSRFVPCPDTKRGKRCPHTLTHKTQVANLLSLYSGLHDSET